MTGSDVSGAVEGPSGAMPARVLPSPGRRACLSRVSFPTLTNSDHPPSLRLCWSGCASTFRGARTSAHGGARVKNARRSKMSVISFGPDFREALTVGVKHNRGRGGKSRSRSGSPDPLGAAKSVPAAPSYVPPTPPYRGIRRHLSESPVKLRNAQSAPAAFSDERPAPADHGIASPAPYETFDGEYEESEKSTSSSEIVFQIFGVDGEEDTLKIIFEATTKPPKNVSLENRGQKTNISIDKLMEELSDEFDKICGQIEQQLPAGATQDIFGVPGGAVIGSIKHLITSRPCETLVNIGVCTFLLYAVACLPASQSYSWFGWGKKIACSNLFRFGPEAAFRSYFNWTNTTSFCTTANTTVNVFADDCACQIWHAVFLSLYPERSNGNKNARITSVAASGLNLVMSPIGGWKKTMKKIQNWLVANSLGPLLRTLSELICGSLGLSRSKDASNAGNEASGGAGPSGVQTSGPGARQDGTGGVQNTSGRSTTRRETSTRARAGKTRGGADLS